MATMTPAPALAPALPCVSLISCIVSFGSTATQTQMSKQRFITSVRCYIAHMHFYSYYTITCFIPIVTCMHAGGRCHALMLQVSIPIVRAVSYPARWSLAPRRRWRWQSLLKRWSSRGVRQCLRWARCCRRSSGCWSRRWGSPPWSLKRWDCSERGWGWRLADVTTRPRRQTLAFILRLSECCLSSRVQAQQVKGVTRGLQN